MAATVYEGKVNIHAFPSIRMNMFAIRPGETKPVADNSSRNLPIIDFGAGWYHSAAVDEAAATPKSR